MTAESSAAPTNKNRDRRVSRERRCLARVALSFFGALSGEPESTRGGGKGSPAWEGGRVSEVLFDAEELVVLGHSIRTRRGAGLDLSRIDRHREVGNGRILRLARAV